MDNRCPPEGLWFEIQTKLASLIAEDLSSGESGFESSGNHSTFFVQSLRRVRLFGTPWTAACHASLSFTTSQSLLKLMSTKSMMPSNHLILPSLSLPAFKLSQHPVFPNESALCSRWPKHWSFSFSVSPSSEYSGLISFRMNCFGLCAVQGTLKSLLQHQSSKASILQLSAFFMVQLSHPYITTGKTAALTIRTLTHLGQ